MLEFLLSSIFLVAHSFEILVFPNPFEVQLFHLLAGYWIAFAMSEERRRVFKIRDSIFALEGILFGGTLAIHVAKNIYGISEPVSPIVEQFLFSLKKYA